MSDLTAADFDELIAERIVAAHVSIAARWLERLRDLLPLSANEVFPSEQLLDHIPALILEIAMFIRTPEQQAVVANTSVTAKAQELGQLRHDQRASIHQLLAEYRLLGSILSHFVQAEVESLRPMPPATHAIGVIRRIEEAIGILTQTTVDTFVSKYTETIAAHASRIESFNRMVSHELRQPLGTLLYAFPLIRSCDGSADDGKRDRLLGTMERNVVRLIRLMEQLEVLSRVQTPNAERPDIQRTEVSAVAWEVARQLREMADSRGVDIRVAPTLPVLEIDVARLELILMNLVSNAIKYSDPAKHERFVEIDNGPATSPTTTCIAVRDNGLGIPADSLQSVFSRFVRVHTDRDAQLRVRGSGLGLAIAAECAEAIGGSIRVQSVVDQGSTFFVFLPQRSSER